MLVPTEIDRPTKKQGFKRNAVGADSTGGLEMVLALFGFKSVQT